MKRGLILDSGRHPRRLFMGLDAATGTPKGKADLRQKAPSVKNQTFCSSCTGHGMATAITTAYAMIGRTLFGLDANGLPVSCSPKDLYAGARCTDREEAGGSVNSPLRDEGSEILSVVCYAASYGVRRILSPITVTDPQTGKISVVDSDVGPQNVDEEPYYDALIEDSNHIVPRAHQIVTVEDRRVTEACLSLDAGHPVATGGFVGTAFEQYTGGIVGAQNLHDPNGGGHCMCLLAYETDSKGRRIFTIRNSWGDWGENGEARVNEEFIKQLQELFAIVATAGGDA